MRYAITSADDDATLRSIIVLSHSENSSKNLINYDNLPIQKKNIPDIPIKKLGKVRGTYM